MLAQKLISMSFAVRSGCWESANGVFEYARVLIGHRLMRGVPKSVVSGARLCAVRKKSRLESSAEVSAGLLDVRSGLKSSSSIVM